MEPEFEQFNSLTRLTLSGFLDELSDQVLFFLFIVMSVVGSVALFDYGWQKFTHLRDLRMSRQEIKEEFKELEGDPHIRSKLKQQREERARQRMMAAVPEATVVVTNPTHYAVALKYELDEMDAPEVVAKGIDVVAQRIRETAEQHDVQIVENPPLARALYADGEIGQRIPAKYYEIVARIIRFVFGYDKTPPPIQEIEDAPDDDAA